MTAEARGRLWASALIAVLPSLASAHRLDELAQAAYLTLAPGEVALELDLAPGEAVAEAIIAALDADADGVITEAEARAYAQEVLDVSPLHLDETPVPWTLSAVSLPDAAAMRAGSDVIRIDATAPRSDVAGTHALTYATSFAPATSLYMANVFLQPGSGWTYAVTGQERSDDGQSLTVTYEATPG